MNDLKFSLRQLRKSPGFTAIAVITLALGIGLNTAIFSLINDLFLRGLPFRQPSRVLHVFSHAKDQRVDFPLSAPRFMHFRDGQTIFDGFAGENGLAATVTGVGDPFQVPIFKTTANYFDVLGVRVIRGRTFLAQEEEGADVAVVTERFWKSRLGGDPNVIGRGLTLDGVSHTIVGVIPTLPVSWTGPNADIWTTKPFIIPGFSHERMMRGTAFLRAVGRLKRGISVMQARAALQLLENSYRKQYPEKIDAKSSTIVKTLPEDVTENLRPGFATLLAAVTFVLLIACSNVANLLLVRFTGRRREISLRMALGATRASVLRLFVFESVLISLLAGIFGAVLAWQLVPVVPRIAANFLPIEQGSATAISFPVLGFTIALSLLTGLVMGLYPALQSSRADIVDALKEGGRGTSGSVRQQRFRKLLVGAQVALSVTLLAGASLLIASFVRLSSQDPGFRFENLWTCFTVLPEAQYSNEGTRARFADQLTKTLRATPGLQEATISTGIPLTGGAGATLYARADSNVPPVAERKGAPSNDISPGWLRTLGIPLLAGRDFTEQDVADHPNVILISASGAKAVFGNENPIGKTLLITSGSIPVEIVGVVGDVRSVRLDQHNDMEFYRPYAQENFPFLSITVRSFLPTDTVTKTVQAALRTIDPNLALILPQPVKEIMRQALGQAKLMMALLGIFAGVALLLATIGIYGAVAYTVEQRTGEIGVRMALGAQTSDVLRLVVRQGMAPVVLGLVIGMVAALALGRLLTTQLYQVSPHNPALLVTTAITLGAVALLACFLPARRATFVNPIEALRAE
ncbi:MAG TPA: ABC transporter permease [Candidatus Udaeobacter sp.]|jgi:putative ABC transport system permease protein|nr:ABC transporter permease [Candidatus Udaeobacter sp.]